AAAPAPRSSAPAAPRASSAACLTLLPLHELRLDWQLGGRERQRFPRQILGDPLELEHHPARLDHRDPPFRIPLAFPHAGLGGLLGDRLVGKDRKSTRLN